MPDPIAPAVIDNLVDLASRAPSAGKTQGWHLLVLEGDDTQAYWNITLPDDKRASFRWKYLLDAPVIALPFADPAAYVARYGEPDKARTGLGNSVAAWPAPYWTIDASMSVMTLLLAAEDAGLGALFFGVFQREVDVRQAFGVPDDLQLIGAVALGYPRLDAEENADGSGRSAQRHRRDPGEIMHRGRWRAPLP